MYISFQTADASWVQDTERRRRNQGQSVWFKVQSLRFKVLPLAYAERRLRLGITAERGSRILLSARAALDSVAARLYIALRNINTKEER